MASEIIYDSIGELVTELGRRYEEPIQDIVNVYAAAFERNLYKYHGKKSVDMIKQYTDEMVMKYYAINHVGWESRPVTWE